MAGRVNILHYTIRTKRITHHVPQKGRAYHRWDSKEAQ